MEETETISYKRRAIRVVIEYDDLLDGWQLCEITDFKSGEHLEEWYSERERMQILDAAIEQNKMENVL